MKITIKIILAATAIAISTFSASAQGFYVKLNGGYNFAMPGNHILTFREINGSPNEQSISYKTGNVSYGRGINLDAGAGYMFSKNIGVELLGSYLSGQSYIITEIRNFQGSSNLKEESANKMNMLRLIPSLIVSSGGEKINLYARFGLAFGVMNKMIYDVEFNYLNLNEMSTTIGESRLERSGGIALGLTAATGASIKISEKISLFGEASMFNMSYSPTKGKYTVAQSNGMDRLSVMSTYHREENFTDSRTFYTTNLPDQNQPQQLAKFSIPMSSIGFNFGVKFNFN